MKLGLIFFAVPAVIAFVAGGCSSSSSSSGDTDTDAGSGGGSDGSTGGGDSGGGNGDATQACSDAASAFCNQVQTCSAFGMQATYGDVATCKTRFALGCMQTLSFPGTSATPATTETCATALPGISCDDFIGQNLGSACGTKAGTLANGAACGDDAQCVSTFCARASDSQCGTCSDPSTVSGPCTNGSCSTGLTCESSKCVKPVAGQIGDACQSQAECDLAHAVGCNTNNNQCLKLEISSDGSCGADSISPSKFTICPANGTCDSLLGGNCHAAAADGASCSTGTSGPSCLSPAKCVSGKCTLPDATACH
ncbi:MAG: hypothetical protein ACRELY_10625 [Polyangiaceae bacterium]